MTRFEALVGIAKEFRLQLVYLFGSQAEAGYAYLVGQDVLVDDPLADLDIGVYRDSIDDLTVLDKLDFYSGLSNRLSEVFAPFRVDLTLLNDTHSVFQAEAVAGSCVYAASSEVREDYELRVLARAADFKPVLDKFYRERLEEL